MNDTEDVLEVQPKDIRPNKDTPPDTPPEDASIVLTFNTRTKNRHVVILSQITEYILYCVREAADNEGIMLGVETVLDGDSNQSSAEQLLVLQQMVYDVQVTDIWDFTITTRAVTLADMSLTEGESLIPALMRRGVVSQIFPLHQKQKKRELKKGWIYKLMHDLPVQLIRDYFGDEIALYFSFINFYTFLLIIPMILGLLVDMFYPGVTTLLEMNDTSWSGEKICFVLFSVFNVVWWALFLEFWQRKSSALAEKWNTLGKKKATLEIVRPEYHGTTITNTAGEPEIFYPADKRRAKQLISALISVISFLCVVRLTQLILTFDSYTLPPPAILSYLLPAYLLPSSLIPTRVIRLTLNILLPVTLRTAYRFYITLANNLTRWENYKHQSTYNNWLLGKLILFRCFTSFHALFYIVFVSHDMAQFEDRLIALMVVTQLKGTIGDMLGSKFRVAVLQITVGICLKSFIKGGFTMIFSYSTLFNTLLAVTVALVVYWTRGMIDGVKQGLYTFIFPQSNKTDSFIQKECDKPKYKSTNDDYMELFIQLGYIIFFAPIYPLAIVWAFISNIVELRGDAFKLVSYHQRPFPVRVKNIGFWYGAFKCLIYCGAVVNCIVIGMQSEEMTWCRVSVMSVMSVVCVAGVRVLGKVVPTAAGLTYRAL